MQRLPLQRHKQPKDAAEFRHWAIVRSVPQLGREDRDQSCSTTASLHGRMTRTPSTASAQNPGALFRDRDPTDFPVTGSGTHFWLGFWATQGSRPIRRPSSFVRSVPLTPRTAMHHPAPIEAIPPSKLTAQRLNSEIPQDDRYT